MIADRYSSMTPIGDRYVSGMRPYANLGLSPHFLPASPHYPASQRGGLSPKTP